MTTQQHPSKALHIALWIAQVLLAATLVWAAAMKLFQPVDKLAAMWPWTGQVSITLVKLTGIADLLGGLGLVLPALLKMRPPLTPIAAVAIVLLMISAGIFHIARGEAALIGVNIFVAFLALFIAWGRSR
jgi:hypothetical protein